MVIHNSEIAEIFARLADLLELEDANPFRVRAYRNASRTVGSHSRSMAEMIRQGEDLSRLPGIGQDLAGKIETLVQTGRLPQLEKVESRTPAELRELMKIEGLGPKRVKRLYEEIGVRSIEDLKRAARNGMIRQLEGFGVKTEETILRHAQRFSEREQRIKLSVAEDVAASLLDYLENCAGVKQLAIAGSYRRRKETVGDLDILISARKDSPVIDRFTEYDEVVEVVSKGRKRSTIRLRSGLQVDLRVVPAVSFGSALHYFTGSKAHNIAVRKIGIRKGYKVNEYGIFRDDKRVAGRTEQEVYARLGLSYIEPELREDRGELQAASNDALPDLVRLEDIRGDLHAHTKATDGRNTLSEMADAAAEKGYEYLAITDHSQHVTVAGGLDPRRLLEHIKAIDKLNGRLDSIRLLKSIEVDILEDGTLDLPDKVLKQLDLCVCSIHYKFDLPRKKQTERILRAMDNPHFTILGHPSGRLINERDGYDIDLERVLKGAKERGCYLELNANPDRLDLTDDGCLLAREVGVKVAISTDAHAVDGLDFMRFGIGQARRGWLEADDVINTRSLDALVKLLRRA